MPKLNRVASGGTKRSIGRYLLAVLVASALSLTEAIADPVAQLPAAWADQLEPIEVADLSGAEPQMRDAIREARQAVAQLLEAPDPQPLALGRAYGRLGARLLLVEVEAQADASFRNAMALDPTEQRWPYYAGYMAMLAGNLDSALHYLERARTIAPDYAPVYLRLGNVQLDRGLLTAADEAFARAGEAEGLRSPARYYRGQIALLQRRFQDAVDLLEAALAANPEATEAHYPLARAYQALGREQTAEQHLNAFVLRSPEIHDPLLAELQASIQRALPAFERAMHAVRRADYDAAVEAFAAGLQSDPKNAAARISYARALYLAGQANQAKSALKQALADADGHRPTASLAQFFSGVLLEDAGQREAAAEAYRQALALMPDLAGAHFQLANLAFRNRRYETAAAGYAAAFRAEPDAAPARLLALIAKQRAGTPERVVAEQLEALRQAAPDDLQLAYADARLRAAAQDPTVRNPEQAIETASELAATAPIPPHQRLLALADAAAGQTGRAANALAALLEQSRWMLPPAERRLAERELEAYKRGESPSPAWPEDDPMLEPPPFDAKRIMRDYPASNPY